MAKFAVGQPLVTQESAVIVDAGLPVGVHRFQLEVLSASGQPSAPVQALIQVQAATVTTGTTTSPTGTITLTGPSVSPVISSTGTPVITAAPVISPTTSSATVATPKAVAPSKPSISRKKKR